VAIDDGGVEPERTALESERVLAPRQGGEAASLHAPPRILGAIGAGGVVVVAQVRRKRRTGRWRRQLKGGPRRDRQARDQGQQRSQPSPGNPHPVPVVKSMAQGPSS